MTVFCSGMTNYFCLKFRLNEQGEKSVKGQIWNTEASSFDAQDQQHLHQHSNRWLLLLMMMMMMMMVMMMMMMMLTCTRVLIQLGCKACRLSRAAQEMGSCIKITADLIIWIRRRGAVCVRNDYDGIRMVTWHPPVSPCYPPSQRQRHRAASPLIFEPWGKRPYKKFDSIINGSWGLGCPLPFLLQTKPFLASTFPWIYLNYAEVMEETQLVQVYASLVMVLWIEIAKLSVQHPQAE